ncbi:MAG TPA: phosphoadenylyl-sulfate reductase [Flavobacterium sp.]|jgi:phosphoadenosine phosphosulfate reductase|uniref:phosphoadenylyl-sulfate reductase n=1 Tax=Flavobacterium sp. TaxID=239 RepID=UPI001B474D98|nr:phosphoadenylyl-sulfate reductase [Flavobacterium sp.]MBP6146385.1 phosphoadenylyl-sulfate reductase [Flavobacterium sp.]MBP7182940.1 phosphoadenylyl-sulfate reductase [Flavobacterium sp.]MBP7317814.1 phosphoadenylyl-sulfate reductase [Flavobacterium sp.]MBP8886863.1 phosphoadenylyl-sulfate reductase [Flavobacterium sp.]HRL70266.1 phosphoadenylyl-sulfate reductase [Flavobacterium sp.]
MSATIVQTLIEKTKDLSIEETFTFLANEYKGKVVFSTSFGQEDQVITHLIGQNDLSINIFTLDTGRLFQETYDVFHKTLKKYKKEIKVYFPEASEVENLLNQKGPNSFYESVENRKECCFIRKVAPLTKALKGNSIWITGLRAEQSENRNDLDLFEYDAKFDIIKFNPLLKWTLQEVSAYLEKNNVPQNALHKHGFVSIGCAPCTRAITPDEDIRAGRWWWESSHKECGLHQK